MVKLLKETKKTLDQLEQEAIEVDLTDKAGFKQMWEKIVNDFDEGESSQAILAKKMGWPDKADAQIFAIECLKTDLISRMDMPLTTVRFKPYYLELTKESDYDKESKKWGKPYPVARGAALIFDDTDDSLKLGIITAKKDASKIAMDELKLGKTYEGSFIDWGSASESDVKGLSVAENSQFREADEPIKDDPAEFLRTQYEKVPVKHARKNFTDPDDFLDFVLVEGKVVSSRIKEWGGGSESRDGILTITDDSISLLDMREAQKTGVRPLIDIKTISAKEVITIGKETYVQAVGPLKNRDQFKKGTEEIERSWNPQLTAKSLIITRLVEKDEAEEPETEEEQAADAGEIYAQAQAAKFDDEEEDEEEDYEEDEEEEELEEEPEEEEEAVGEEEEDEEEEECEEFGAGYDSEDENCQACDDAEECEKIVNARKAKKAKKKKK